MRILISGGAGFIGSHTAELLAKRNHEVVIIDNFSTGRMENLKEFKGRILPGDICDWKWLDSIFSDFRPEAILHLGAQSAITTSVFNPQNDLKVNGIGTLNILMMAKKYGANRFVFSSTSAVYREFSSFLKVGMSERWPLHPASPYGISKLAAEHYIRLVFPNYLIMRFGNVYGPRQRPIGDNLVIARALEHFIHGKDFEVNGHGNQKRDFVYVGDVADCCHDAITQNVVGTFNVSSGRSYSVNEVLSEIGKIYAVPNYAWSHNQKTDPRNYVGLNVKSIRRYLGWKARVSLAEGLKLTTDWWEENK